MSQVSLVKIGTQGASIARHSDGISREGIPNEVTDGEVNIKRQIRSHKRKTPSHDGL
mgnify:CR=1 FL=1